VVLDYIGQFGYSIMVQFQKVLKYITKIGMGTITNYPILNYCQSKNINNGTEKIYLKKLELNFWEILKKLDKKDWNGTNQKQAYNGIIHLEKNMEKNLGQIPNIENSNVSYAEELRKHEIEKSVNSVRLLVSRKIDWIVEKIISLKSVQFAAKLFRLINIVIPEAVHIVAVQKLGLQKVYNIKVDKCGIYFANGFLVSNCNAVQYIFSTYDTTASVDYQAKKKYENSLEYITITPDNNNAGLKHS
jgi:hypothetical protein